MVLEAHRGGWSPLLRKVFDWISKQQALVTNEEQAVVSLRVAQRISCTLHRENARAILRRQAKLSDNTFQLNSWDDPDVGI